MDQIIVSAEEVVLGIFGSSMLIYALLRLRARELLREAAGDDDKDPSEAVDDIAKLLKDEK